MRRTETHGDARPHEADARPAEPVRRWRSIDPECRRLVGMWIQARRGELGKTIRTLAKEAGVVRQTIQNAEAGRTMINPANRAAVEAALSWPPGALTRAYMRGIVPSSDRADDGADADAGSESTSELIDPSLAELFHHPDIDPDTRRVLIRRLHSLQREFAEQSRDFFDLNTDD